MAAEAPPAEVSPVVADGAASQTAALGSSALAVDRHASGAPDIGSAGATGRLAVTLPRAQPLYPIDGENDDAVDGRIQRVSQSAENIPPELRPHPGYVLTCKVGRKTVYERVDNGACVSMVRTDVFREFDASAIIEQRSITPKHFGVAAKGGPVIVSSLIANLVVERETVGGTSFRTKEWVYVSDHIAEEKLVGSGSCERLGVRATPRGVCFSNVQGEPVVTTVQKGRRAPTEADKPAIRLVTVLPEPRQIPPQHSCVMKLAVKAEAPCAPVGNSLMSIPESWVPFIAGQDFLLEPSSAAVHAVVCRVEDGSTQAILTNDSDELLVVPAGQCGSLTCASVHGADVVSPVAGAAQSLLSQGGGVDSLDPKDNTKRSWPDMRDPGIEDAVRVATDRARREAESLATSEEADIEPIPPITLPEALDAAGEVSFGPELDSAAKTVGQFIHFAASDVFTYRGRHPLIESDPVHMNIHAEKPWCSQMYRMSPKEIRQLRDLLEEYLRAGILEPSNSPYAVSPLLQQKADGRARLVLDVRKPNSCTEFDAYPLPQPVQVFAELGLARLLSTYDFKDGFFGVALALTSRKFTAFRTLFGLFQFRRLIQGGRNSAQVFQRIGNQNFLDFLWKFLVIYVDDSCVYTKDFCGDSSDDLNAALTVARSGRDRLMSDLGYHAAEMRDCDDELHDRVQKDLDAVQAILVRIEFTAWSPEGETPFAVEGLPAVREWQLYLRHARQTIAFLRRVRLKGYTIAHKKAQHGFREVVYVGKCVGRSGLSASDKLVNAIANFPRPVTPEHTVDAKGLRGFLGLCAYFREGVHIFARKSAELREALRCAEAGLSEWTPVLEMEFQALKDDFLQRLNLAVPDTRLPWIILTDWSTAGIGASLFQLRLAADSVNPFTSEEWAYLVSGPQMNSARDSATTPPLLVRLTVTKLRPFRKEAIAVCSRALSDAEKKYPPREGEALSLTYAGEMFECLLRSKFSTVLTDHSSLQFLQTASAGRVGRWAAGLSQFFIAVQYWPGRLNAIDAPSRWPDVEAHVPESDEDVHDVVFVPCYEHREAAVLARAAEAIRDGRLNREVLTEAQTILADVYSRAYDGRVVGAPEVHQISSLDAWQSIELSPELVASLAAMPVGTVSNHTQLSRNLREWFARTLGLRLLASRVVQGRSCRWLAWTGLDNQGYVAPLIPAFSSSLSASLSGGEIHPVNLGLGAQFTDSTPAVLFAVERTDSLLGSEVGILDDSAEWTTGVVTDVDMILGEISVQLSCTDIVRVSVADEVLLLTPAPTVERPSLALLSPDTFLDDQRNDDQLHEIMNAVTRQDPKYRFYTIDNDTGILSYQTSWRRDRTAWRGGLRWVVPKNRIADVFHCAHVIDGQHAGREDTLLRVAARFYWPDMFHDVVRLLRQCVTCAADASAVDAAALGTSGTAQASQPFTSVSVDEVGPLPESRRGNSALFSVLDRFSRLHASEPIRYQNSDDFGLAFLRFSCREGFPEDIVGDKGAVVRERVPAISRGIGAHFGTSGSQNPRSNPVERVHRELRTALRKYITDEGSEDWESAAALFDLAWATKVLPLVGCSRFFVGRGREPRAPSLAGAQLEVPRSAADFVASMRASLPKVLDLALAVDTEVRAKRLERADKERDAVAVEVGEFVMWSDPLLREGPKTFTPKLSGPYEVTHVDPQAAQRVQLNIAGEERWVNTHELRRWRATAFDVATSPGHPDIDDGLVILRHIRELLQAQNAARLAAGQCMRQLYSQLPWAKNWLSKRGGLAQLLRGALRRSSRVRLESSGSGGASYIALGPAYRCSCTRCVRHNPTDADAPRPSGPFPTCRVMISTEGPRCSACEHQCRCYCFFPIQPHIAVAQVTCVVVPDLEVLSDDSEDIHPPTEFAPASFTWDEHATPDSDAASSPGESQISMVRATDSPSRLPVRGWDALLCALLRRDFLGLSGELDLDDDSRASAEWWAGIVTDEATCEWVRSRPSEDRRADLRGRIRCTDPTKIAVHPAFGAELVQIEVDLDHSADSSLPRGLLIQAVEDRQSFPSAVKVILGKPVGEPKGGRQRYRAHCVTGTAHTSATIPSSFGKFSSAAAVGNLATALQRLWGLTRLAFVHKDFRYLCDREHQNNLVDVGALLLTSASAGDSTSVTQAVVESRERATVVLGPPGTGKSRLISHVLRAPNILAAGRALCIAPSNAAVESLADKLGNLCLVVGNADNLGPRATERMFVHAVPEVTERRAAWERVRVVLATPFAAAMAPRRILDDLEDGSDEHIEFPTVIIDEGAAMLAIDAIAACTYGCQRLIVVGDPRQLPPYTGTPRSTSGLSAMAAFTCKSSNSTMKRSADIFFLDTQYRMHPTIAAFPSLQFYDGRLHTGLTPEESPAGFPWPDPANPVCFVPMHSLEDSDGRSTFNTQEVEAVAECCVAFLEAGLQPVDIGIISPYRAQVGRIKARLQAHGPIAASVEVASVDSYQGREKEVIIFSTVRSNPHRRVGFTSDKARINVAFTRARRGFIVFGNSRTLRSDAETWRHWLSWVRQRGLVAPEIPKQQMLRLTQSDVASDIVSDGTPLEPVDIPVSFMNMLD